MGNIFEEVYGDEVNNDREVQRLTPLPEQQERDYSGVIDNILGRNGPEPLLVNPETPPEEVGFTAFQERPEVKKGIRETSEYGERTPELMYSAALASDKEFKDYISSPFISKKVEESENPAEATALYTNMYTMAKTTGLKPEYVYDRYEELADKYFGPGGNEISRGENNKKAWQLGVMTVEIAHLNGKIVDGNATDEDIKRKDELEAFLPNVVIDFKDVPAAMAQSVLKNLPIMVDYFKSFYEVPLRDAALVEDLEPEEYIKTVIENTDILVNPVKALGLALGSVVGRPVKQMGHMMQGMVYDEIKREEGENGELISDEIAIPIAKTAGNIDAIIESAEVASLFLGGLLTKTIGTKVGARVASTILGSGIARRVAIKSAAGLGIAVLEEEIEEFAQMGVDSIAVEIAKAISPDHKAFDGSTTKEEFVAEVQATWFETMYTSIVLGLIPGAGRIMSQSTSAKAGVQAAIKEAVLSATDDNGISAAEVLETLKTDERITILKDKKIDKILSENKPMVELLDKFNQDPENITTSLVEMYDKEAQVEYQEYINEYAKSDSDAPAATFDEFRTAYLGTQGRAIPIQTFSDAQITSMYYRYSKEFSPEFDGHKPMTMAQYQESVRSSGSFYESVENSQKKAESLTRMTEAMETLKEFEADSSSETSPVVKKLLEDMAADIETAKVAAEGEDVTLGRDAAFKGPDVYTTKDVELVGKEKIASIDKYIEDLNTLKDSEEISPAMRKLANDRIESLNQRKIELERHTDDVGGLLRNQYNNLEKSAAFVERQAERAARINERIEARNEPGYKAVLGGYGAELVLAELEDARRESGSIDLSKVPLDIALFMSITDENVDDFTASKARVIWNQAAKAVSEDKLREMTIGRAQKAFKNDQARRIEALFTQINRPVGKNITIERQQQIALVREMLGIRSAEEVDFKAIITAVRDLSRKSERRVPNPEAGLLVGQFLRMRGLLRDVMATEMSEREAFWNEKVLPELSNIKETMNDEEVAPWAKKVATEYMKDIAFMELPYSYNEIAWRHLSDEALAKTEIAFGEVSIQLMTKEAFQEQIEGILSEISTASATEKVTMSVKALEQAKQLIDYLRYIGKREMEVQKDGILTKSQSAADRINEKMGYAQEGWKIAKDVNESGKVKKAVLAAKGTLLHPVTFFRNLGGQELVETFVTDKKYSQNEEAISIRDRDAKINGKMKELKIKVKDLADTVTISGQEVQVQDLMGVYVAMKNEKSKAALIDYGMMPLKVAENIESYLTTEQIQLADAIGDDLLSAWGRMSTVFMAVTGKALGKEESYLSIVRKYREGQGFEDALMTEIVYGTDKAESGVYKGFGESRVLDAMTEEEKAEAKASDEEIKLSLFDMWTDSVHKQEHFISAAENVAVMKRALDASSKAITKRMGATILSQANKYVEDYANPAGIHGSSVVDKMARTLRGNVTFSHLAAAPSIIFRQGLSGPLYMMYVSPKEYFGAVNQFLHNPKKMMREVTEMAPSVVQSGTGFDLVNTRVGNAKGLAAAKRKIQDKGMYGITLADQITKAIGFTAVYNQEVGNVGHVEAVKAALAITDLTQPTSDRTSLPDAYRHGAIFDWALMYSQQPMKIFNMMTAEMGFKAQNVKYDKNEVGNMVYGSIAIITSMAGIWILKNRRLPETPEDYASILIGGAIGDIPIVGKQLISGASGRYSSGSSASDIPKYLGKLVSDAPAKEKLNGVFYGILPGTTGIMPGNSVQNVFDYIETGKPGEFLLGGQWGK